MTPLPVSSWRIYAGAIRQFERDWCALPRATPESMACYIADNAATLSVNTLKSRQAGLSR